MYKQFEYLTRSIDVIGKGIVAIDMALDRWGEDGWELVSVVPGTGSIMVFFFKRHLRHASNNTESVTDDEHLPLARQAEALE